MCRRRWEFRKPSAEDGLNGVAVLGVAKALMVYFGSIQETSCPIKHWFDCSRLLSVLMRLEHNQALLPALVLTLLTAAHFHCNSIAEKGMKCWAFLPLQFALNCNLHRTPVLYPPFSSFCQDQLYQSQQKMNKKRESGSLFAVVCNKRSSLSQETCRGVRWMCLVCSETVGSWSLMELLWGSRW